MDLGLFLSTQTQGLLLAEGQAKHKKYPKKEKHHYNNQGFT
jgi:hypothetical protein